MSSGASPLRALWDGLLTLSLRFSPSPVSAAYTERRAFDQLLELWFPSAPGAAPRAVEPAAAPLFQDWLKLRMIRSSTARLVDAALADLEPAQLLLFIQSFGVPVASMT